MKRILFSKDKLAISPPGKDVSAGTTTRDFLFNSSMAAPFGVFMSGAVGVGSFALAFASSFEGGNIYWHKYTISYGKTFPTIPVVFVAVESSTYAGSGAGYLYLSRYGSAYLIASPANDHLDLYICYWPTDNVSPPPSVIAFAIGHG
jgi:hypothetical protein